MHHRITAAGLLTSAMILAFALTPLHAAEVDTAALDSALDEAALVEPGDADSWLAAREALLAFGPDAVDALNERAQESAWTREGWVRAMVAADVSLRLSNADLAAQVDAPRGIDPERYRLFRDAKPHCQHELAHMGKEIVPLLLERWRWTFGSFAFSEGEAGELERDVFARAILYVPGFLEDARARFFLEDVLADDEASALWRQQAAVSLGQTGGAQALTVLGARFDDPTEAIEVREGCGWAFGRVAALETVEAMKPRLADLADAEGETELRLVRALLTGVGLLGSSWAWRARGAEAAALGEQIRRECADMAIEALERHPAEVDFVSRALVLTAWPESLERIEALSKDADVADDLREAAGKIVEPLRVALQRAGK